MSARNGETIARRIVVMAVLDSQRRHCQKKRMRNEIQKLILCYYVLIIRLLKANNISLPRPSSSSCNLALLYGARRTTYAKKSGKIVSSALPQPHSTYLNIFIFVVCFVHSFVGCWFFQTTSSIIISRMKQRKKVRMKKEKKKNFWCLFFVRMRLI